MTNQEKALEIAKLVIDAEPLKCEILLNCNYGGYAVSKKVYKLMNIEWDGFGYAFENMRGNPELIKIFKILGDEFSKNPGDIKLQQIDLSDLLNGYIDDYDGQESIVYNNNGMKSPIVEKMNSKSDY